MGKFFQSKRRVLTFVDKYRRKICEINLNSVGMSGDEQVEVKPFAVERAKQGRAKCAKCKNQCEVRHLLGHS